ncbi:coiled-coil domain-containing protein [Mycolicibacterium sp. CBM1]
MALSLVGAAVAYAEPEVDELAKLNELTEQAQHLIETAQAVEQDLDRKLQLQSVAERKHADDLAVLEDTRAQLAGYQAVVDKAAAAFYAGGRTDSVSAFLTAASPQRLIDELAVQRAITDDMSGHLADFRRAQLRAQAVEAASAESAAQAKAAADAAAALQAELETKQSEVETQVRLVRATYYALPAAQQALLGPGGAIPTVGMSGLVPSARTLAAYVIATYPGVQSVGGVRPDPIPDHPSGHAIDIMIGSDMALGDVINADVQSQAERFGVSYTMWRVANHFNHVHITVS